MARDSIIQPRIVDYLENQNGEWILQQDIANKLNIKNCTVSYSIKQLRLLGVLERRIKMPMNPSNVKRSHKRNQPRIEVRLKHQD